MEDDDKAISNRQEEMVVRIDNKKFEFLLNEKVLDTFGACSLTGGITNARPKSFPKDVTIVFEETSIGWKRQNGGPNYWIIPEYAINCLIEDILYLVESRGVKFTLKKVEKDPPTSTKEKK